MRIFVDLPAEDWPTLPEPGDKVAEVISGTYALPLTVLGASRVGALVRLELDAPARTIERFMGEPVDHPGYEHVTAAVATGSAFVCSDSLVEWDEMSAA